MPTEKIWLTHPESECAWIGTRDELANLQSDGNVMDAGPAIKGTKEELFSFYVHPETVFKNWDIKEGFNQ